MGKSKSKRKFTKNNAGGNGEQGPSSPSKVLRSTPSSSNSQICQDCTPKFSRLQSKLEAKVQTVKKTNEVLRKTLEQMMHEKDKKIVEKDLLNENLKQEIYRLKENQVDSKPNDEKSEEMKSQLDEVLTSEMEWERKDKQIEILKSEIKMLQFNKKLDLLETQSHDHKIDDLKKQVLYQDKVIDNLRHELHKLENKSDANHGKNLLLLTKFSGPSGSLIEKQVEAEKQIETEKQIEIDNMIEKLKKEKSEMGQVIYELKSEIETLQKSNEKTQEQAEKDAKSLLEFFDEEVEITKKEELIADLTKQLQEKDKLNKELQSKVSLLEGEKSTLVTKIQELTESEATAKRRIDDNEKAFCLKDSIIRKLTKEKEELQEKNGGGAHQMEVEDQEESDEEEEEEDENDDEEEVEENLEEQNIPIANSGSGIDSWILDSKDVEIDNLKAVVYKKKEEIAELKRKHIKLEEHNDKLKIEINLTKGGSGQAKSKKDEEEVERVRKTLSHKNLQLQSLQLQKVEHLKKIRDLEEEKSNLIHVFKLQSKKNEQQLADKNQQVEGLQKEVGKTQKEIQDLKVDNAFLKKEICTSSSSQLDEELFAKLQDDVNAKSQELETKSQELEELKAQISKMASVMMEMVEPKPAKE